MVRGNARRFRLFLEGAPGVPELKEGEHGTVGRMRLNLTFRGAL
jgi:hypothetical protein